MTPALCLWVLAPRLAPLNLVSAANVQRTQRGACGQEGERWPGGPRCSVLDQMHGEGVPPVVSLESDESPDRQGTEYPDDGNIDEATTFSGPVWQRSFR